MSSHASPLTRAETIACLQQWRLPRLIGQGIALLASCHSHGDRYATAAPRAETCIGVRARILGTEAPALPCAVGESGVSPD
jgi:hypothetical protein